MNQSQKALKTIVLAGILTAIGIIIPLFSPIKITIDPASFTLASHVAIFIGMFVSPVVGISVTLGTTLGFLLAGFPISVVMRALSHLVFVTVGGFLLKKKPGTLESIPKTIAFAALISIIHGICEVLISIPFYVAGPATQSFFIAIILLVGVGTFVHSMIDFLLAYIIWQPLKKLFPQKAVVFPLKEDLSS